MEISRSIEIIKALGDESRLEAVNCLFEKPYYVEELASRLNLAVSTVSFHLKKLELAGLVRKNKEQYYATFTINEKLFNLTLRDLTSFTSADRPVQEERLRQYREKVIRTFIKKGKLTALPVQKKKKLIILKEFRRLFRSGRSYTEKEVDVIINTLFDDHCTIRRLMIEENLMTRENQIYRLTEETGTKMKDKNQLKKEYIQNPPPMGVYKITNLVNGKIFIGSNLNVNGRINRHKFSLVNGNEEIKDLLEDYRKYGEDKIVFEIIDILKPKDEPGMNYKEELETLEELWKEKLQPYGDKGYNILKDVKK